MWQDQFTVTESGRVLHCVHRRQDTLCLDLRHQAQARSVSEVSGMEFLRGEVVWLSSEEAANRPLSSKTT